MSAIHIQLNGERRQLPAPATLTELLEQLGLVEVRLAVEINGAVVPRARHHQHLLGDGDQIEIVTFVGGG